MPAKPRRRRVSTCRGQRRRRLLLLRRRRRRRGLRLLRSRREWQLQLKLKQRLETRLPEPTGTVRRLTSQVRRWGLRVSRSMLQVAFPQ